MDFLIFVFLILIAYAGLRERGESIWVKEKVPDFKLLLLLPFMLIAMKVIYLPLVFDILDFGIEDVRTRSHYDTNFDRIKYFLIAVCVGPIVEEVFFRRFLFSFWKNKLGLYFSALLSSLVFGLFHFFPVNIIVSFLLGILFVFLYHRSGSLLVIVYAHSVHNVLSLFDNYLRNPLGFYFFKFQDSVDYIKFSIALIILTLGIYWILKNYKPPQQEKTVSTFTN